MSDSVFQELLLRLSQEETFASWARDNPTGLRKNFDLTEEEAARLATMVVEPVAAEAKTAEPMALGTRQSKSGIIAIGGAAAVLTAGAAVFGLTHLPQSGGGAASANSGHPTLAIISVEGTGGSGDPIELTCGGGRSPVAGGFAILDGGGAPVPAPGLHVADNAATATGWTVRVTGAPAGSRVLARATCARASREGQLSGDFDGVQGYEVVPGTPPGPKAGPRLTACPVGRVPLGAGFTGGQSSLASEVPGVPGYEFDDPAGTATPLVICALGGQDVKAQLASGALGWQLAIGPTVPLAAGKMTTTQAECPSGWHGAGGGYLVESGAAVVTGNIPSGNAWEVDATSAGGAASLTPYAVCVT